MLVIDGITVILRDPALAMTWLRHRQPFWCGVIDRVVAGAAVLAIELMLIMLPPGRTKILCSR